MVWCPTEEAAALVDEEVAKAKEVDANSDNNRGATVNAIVVRIFPPAQATYTKMPTSFRMIFLEFFFDHEEM